MTVGRYEESHPWISFSANFNRLPITDWILLGEGESKCEHLAGAPLTPDVARELSKIYLTRGVYGTTSIEGNQLSLAEVEKAVEGRLEVAPSREYQAREVENIISAYSRIQDDILRGEKLEVTPDRIRYFNLIILDGTELQEDVVPGEYRTHSVVAGRDYVGPPAGDCEYLVERLCEWINGPDFRTPNDELRFPYAVFRSILAHLYLAWIHPFGDGNGRTARLIEFQIMLQAGVPMPAAHLLSDHYNQTRQRYMRNLAESSKSGGDVGPFTSYAIRGFIDGIREQLQVVRYQQLTVTWHNFVYEHFKRYPNSPTTDRQREIVLNLHPGEPRKRGDIRHLTTKIEQLYADKTDRTLTRDINALKDQNLIKRVSGGWVSNVDIILSFLPLTARDDYVIRGYAGKPLSEIEP